MVSRHGLAMLVTSWAKRGGAWEMEQRTNRAKRRLRDHPSDEDKDRYIEIWKKAVETQMHFNEMSVKSRQLGLTFVTASLGVAVVMIARGDDFALSVGTWSVTWVSF